MLRTTASWIASWRCVESFDVAALSRSSLVTACRSARERGRDRSCSWAVIRGPGLTRNRPAPCLSSEPLPVLRQVGAWSDSRPVLARLPHPIGWYPPARVWRRRRSRVEQMGYGGVSGASGRRPVDRLKQQAVHQQVTPGPRMTAIETRERPPRSSSSLAVQSPACLTPQTGFSAGPLTVTLVNECEVVTHGVRRLLQP